MVTIRNHFPSPAVTFRRCDDGAAHDQAIHNVQCPGDLPGGDVHVDGPEADAACFFFGDLIIREPASFLDGCGIPFDVDRLLKRSFKVPVPGFQEARF